MSPQNGEEQQNTRLLLDIVQRLGIVEGQNAMIIQAEGRAADGRTKIFDIVTEINDRIDGVDLKLQKIDELEKEVDALKKHAAEAQRFHDRLRTVLWIITPVGSAIMIAVGVAIKDQWERWFGR